MSPEDSDPAAETDRSAPSLGRDDSGWLRMPGRAGCDPVLAISRDDAAGIGRTER
ncbi:hypothetical protein [Nocardia sp. CDC160]|uniref:hypothetical protein n=1 Tax=Nocardia sp. CDC160 TaxID=3112166 RepID=UPI002DB86D83|nr:hypothetical protein [Nocardia sp. CDC160]MEC3917929.1 hypothetical protein [Nocardia sp. CDC160]